jgi:uncharacterized glyoxalase superfamily protein PhnB
LRPQGSDGIGFLGELPEGLAQEAAMQLSGTIPVLRIFDEDKAREFYVGFLGFAVDWEHRFEPGLPLYMQVSRDRVKFQLSEHHGDACPGSSVVVLTEGVDAYNRDLLARGYKYYRPGVEQTPWGSRDMSVQDPFGNRIIFREYVGGGGEAKGQG